jgi:hypothetical protein
MSFLSMNPNKSQYSDYCLLQEQSHNQGFEFQLEHDNLNSFLLFGRRLRNSQGNDNHQKAHS